VSIADANCNTTSYVRNGFGDVIQQASPDSGVSVFQYDADANLTSKTDALAIVTNQTFDALDRPLATTYPANTAENVAYTYDQTGSGFAFGIDRLTSVTDAAGSLTKRYEERGNLASENRVNGSATLTTSYTYDGASHVASMTYPDGTLVTNQYDAAGYLASVSAKPAGSSTTTTIATVTHQPFGPRNALTYGNGISETWAYDNSYRPTNITDTLSGIKLQSLTYGYDNANNVGSVIDAVNAANSQTLGYDVINRLTSAASGPGGYGGYSWSYDKVGNRLTQIVGSTTSTYAYTSGTNRLASITTGTAMTLLPVPWNIKRQRSAAITFSAQVPPHIFPTRGPGRPSIPAQQPPANVLVAVLGWPMLLVGFGGVVVFRKRLLDNRLLAVPTILALFTGATTLLIGCANPSTSTETRTVAVPAASPNGIVRGGQQPITGATIQLYAVGTAGDASAATPLIPSVVLTDQNGNFSITSKYICPSGTTEVYLVATAATPGWLPGRTTRPS
jgi:YD repeat-containing protein